MNSGGGSNFGNLKRPAKAKVEDMGYTDKSRQFNHLL
jgi:hypothetical protein